MLTSSLSSQLVEIPGADGVEDGDVGWTGVVGIGPGPGAEGSPLIAQRHLGVDAIPQVDAVGMVLGGGQHQAGEGHIAWIHVHPTASLGGISPLQLVGLMLDVGKQGGVHQLLEGHDHPHQWRAELGGVVVGVGEGEQFTAIVEGAKRLGEQGRGSSEPILVWAKDAGHQFHRWGDFGLPHMLTSLSSVATMSPSSVAYYTPRALSGKGRGEG